MVRELNSDDLPDEAAEISREDMLDNDNFDDLEGDLEEMLAEETDQEEAELIAKSDGPVVDASGPEESPPNEPKELEEPEKPSPAEVNPLQADILRQIRDAENRCQNAELAVLNAKLELKDEKAEFAGAVTALRSLIKSLTNDNTRPLIKVFDVAEQNGDSKKQTDPGKEQTDEADPELLAEEAEFDELLMEDLAVLGLSDATFGKLVECGVETIGGLEELRKDISKGKARWPKGIGRVTVTKIEEAVIEWLANLEISGDADTEDKEEK